MTLPSKYYPEKTCPADLDRIAKRAQIISNHFADNGMAKDWVIFKNGTVIAVFSGGDSGETAKNILNECMSNHPDFQLATQDFEGVPCHILLMNQYKSGDVSTYLFGDEWQKTKKINSKKLMCESEVLIGVDPKDEAIKIGLYARLRVFADGRNPEIDRIVSPSVEIKQPETDKEIGTFEIDGQIIHHYQLTHNQYSKFIFGPQPYHWAIIPFFSLKRINGDSHYHIRECIKEFSKKNPSPNNQYNLYVTKEDAPDEMGCGSIDLPPDGFCLGLIKEFRQ